MIRIKEFDGSPNALLFPQGPARTIVPPSRSIPTTQTPPATAPVEPEVTEETSDFRTTPGYEFRLGEGRRAVENSAISRGGLLSGRAMKDLERFGQDYGSAEYQNVFNRRATIAGINPVSVSNLNAVTGNYGNTSGSILGNLGNGLASSYLQQGQGYSNALQGLLGNVLFSQYLEG